MDDNRQSNALMEALGFHTGCLRWVSSWSVGKNNGGLYIRFFADRAKYSIVVVYENDFHKLPPAIVKEAKTEGAYLRPKRAATTERDDAEADGKLHECDLMLITRYQFNPGKENERWHFGGIYKTIKRKETTDQRGQQVTQPPPQPTNNTDFKNLADALNWAVAEGAYPTYDDAKVAWEGLKYRNPQASGSQWRNMVQEVLRAKKKVPV